MVLVFNVSIRGRPPGHKIQEFLSRNVAPCELALSRCPFLFVADCSLSLSLSLALVNSMYAEKEEQVFFLPFLSCSYQQCNQRQASFASLPAGSLRNKTVRV